MNESTTDIRIVPLPNSQDVLTDILRHGATPDARPGHRGRGRRLDRRTTPTSRMTPGVARSSATATCPSGPSTPASGRSRSSSPGSMTAGPPTSGRSSASAILPPYLRKTKSLEELIPWLYLKGVSTGDFSEALAGDPRPRCQGAVGDHRHPAQGGLGGRVSRPGASGRWRASITSTSGPTACTSTSAWRRAGSASWC